MKVSTIHKVTKQISIIALSVLLISCGDESGLISETRIGQLVGTDVVDNLLYVTETHSGKTNQDGEFAYEPGESIRFYNGSVLIGKTKAEDIITSFSLAKMSLPSEALAIRQ